MLDRTDFCPRLGKRQRALFGEVGELVGETEVFERLPERGRPVRPRGRLEGELGKVLLVFDGIAERTGDDKAIDG